MRPRCSGTTAATRRRATSSAARSPPSQFTAWLARQPVRRIDHGDEVIPFDREARRTASGDDSAT